MKYKVIPSILSSNEEEIKRRLNIIKSFSDTVSVDIIDGTLTGNKILPAPEIFKPFTETLFLELHMIVSHPEAFVSAYSGFKRYIGHVEKIDINNFVKEVTVRGAEAWLGLTSKTPAEVVLDETLIEKGVTGFTILSVKGGYSGDKFEQEALLKVRKIRDFFGDKVDIEVDGGINEKTILLAKEAGANCFIANSYLFKSSDPKENFNKLSRLV